MFEFPLSDIRELEFSNRFRGSRFFWLLLWAGLCFPAYLFIAITWLKWVAITFCVVAALSVLIELRDKQIIIHTTDGRFEADVEDSESEADVHAFIASVKSRIRNHGGSAK